MKLGMPATNMALIILGTGRGSTAMAGAARCLARTIMLVAAHQHRRALSLRQRSRVLSGKAAVRIRQSSRALSGGLASGKAAARQDSPGQCPLAGLLPIQ